MDGQKVSDVVSRLKAAASSTWQDEEWDGLQAGSLNATVSGVAVAWTPSIDVLKKATKSDCNLVLTKDPLYWSEEEGPRPSQDSVSSRIAEGMVGATNFSVVEATALYKEKRDLVAQSGMNVFRVSQNWNGADGIPLRGLMDALKWKQQEMFVADPQAAPHGHTAIASLPPTSILQVAQDAKQKIGAKSVRVLGEKSSIVMKVAVHPGFVTIAAMRRIARTPGLDLIVTGEGCEWEAFPYAEDWIDAGHGKGLVMLGLAVTSDTGAKEFANWVRTAVSPMRVEFLPVGDPFTPIYAGGLRT